MRVTLFGLGPDTRKAKPSAINYVAKQVRTALEKFRATKETVKETSEKFDRWIEDRNRI